MDDTLEVLISRDTLQAIRDAAPCVKRRHATRESAEAERTRMVLSGRDSDPEMDWNVWLCSHCDAWHIGHDKRRAKGMTTKQDEIRRVVAELRQHQVVLVCGGSSGFYDKKIARDPRVAFVESTESGGRWETRFVLPKRAGVVFVTKFLSVSLAREIARQSKDMGVPVFGVFSSPGAVNRALSDALLFGATRTPEHTTEPTIIAPPETEQIASVGMFPEETTTQETPVTTPDAPASTEQATTSDEQELINVFNEAKAALDVALDAALTVVRASRQTTRDAAKLRALMALLKEGGE